jgi:glycine oxidase
VSIVVVGGGVIGFSVAELLARRGADVQVLDMRGPGAGATQASAGMLVPHIEGHHEALLRTGVRSLALYDEFVRQLEITTGLDIEYARCGSLQVARTPAHAASLEGIARDLEARRVPHTLMSGVEARALEPALGPEISSGLLVAEHGYVHVGALMAALVRSAEQHGARTRRARIETLDRVDGRWSLRLESGSIEADVVVLAAGSWSGALGLSRVPVRPIRGQALEMAAVTPPLGRVIWCEDCYLVPWRNGSTIVGATVEDVGFDEAPTEEARTTLQEASARVVPALASAQVRSVRTGLRPATADELPLVGWSPEHPRLMLATGHYRNGILLAPLTARLVADTLLGTPDPEDAAVRLALSPGRATVLS